MKKLNPEQKKLVAYGAGAGLGIVVPYAIKKFVDNAYPSPLIPMIGVWGKWSTFIPIVTGAGALLITLFTSKYVKNQNTKGMLAMYGFSSLVTGTMSGLIDMGYLGTSARANLAYTQPRYAVRTAPVVRQAVAGLSNGVNLTPTGISNKIIRA